MARSQRMRDAEVPQRQVTQRCQTPNAAFFLTCGKMMWFRKNSVVFQIVIPHCTAVLMTRVGSGAVSKVQHGVSGGKNDILFAFLGIDTV